MMPRDVPLVEDLAEVAVTRLRAAAGDAGEARLRRLGRRLLLKDSKSTFLIENETPSLTMAQRWGEEIAKAGSVPLDLVLMTRLQKLLMSERRFMVTGLRRAGVLRKKVRHPWLGGARRLTMYLATLDCATSIPSLSSSPWMRGAPQSGFSTLIRRISTRSSVSICGRPPRRRDFQRQ